MLLRVTGVLPPPNRTTIAYLMALVVPIYLKAGFQPATLIDVGEVYSRTFWHSFPFSDQRKIAKHNKLASFVALYCDFYKFRLPITLGIPS